MDASSTELDKRTRQQEAVAELGQQALETDDVDQLLDDAAAVVADTLDIAYCDVLELLSDSEEALLRAGVGWRDGLVGSATVPTTLDSQAGYALVSEEPVVVENRRYEQRFSGSELLADHDVVSGVSVVVGPDEEPWGVLGAHTTEQRAFAEHDVTFVRSVANVLASAIENDRAKSEVEEVYGRISEAFFALDEEFRFTHLNERAHELINPDGRTLVGERVWDEFPDTAERKFEEQYRQAMREQETVSFEEYYPEPLDAWFEVRAHPSETGLSVHFWDVTERKHAQQILEDERDMFAEGPATVFQWGAGDGWSVEYVSRNVEDVFGYTPEELESGAVSYADLLLDEEIDRITREIEANCDETTERFSHEPYRIETKDGDVRWVQDTTKVIRDESGDIAHYLGYLVDITDRKERERELQREQRRFEAIFEDPNILVGLLDPDGTVRDINQTAMEYVDADLDDVTGEPFWETPWWSGGNEVQNDVREWTERAASGEYVDFEVDLARPNGERYDLNGVFRPVTNDDGDVVSVIVSDRDVTERREYERRLAESEQRHRALAENFPNGVVTLYDHDLTYTLAAGQAFEGFPVTPDEVEGQTPLDVWGEDVGDILVPRMQSALDGDGGTVELSYLDRDWVIYVVPITDEDGDVFAGMTMAQDITERTEYQRRLEQSEQRYRTLAEHFPNGAVGVYDEDLRYTLTEGVAVGDTLPPAEEVEGRRMPEIFPEDTVAELEPVFRAAVEDGKIGTTTTEIGGRFWRVWAGPLRDGDGEVFAGLSFAQDVTEQVEREQQLERYETIVETVNDGVYVVDQDGDFATVNDAYAEMLGYAPSELIGTDASQVVVNGDEAVGHVEELQTASADGRLEQPSMEAELRTASGETLPVEATFALLTDDGESEWYRVGVVRDISERKKRERQLAQSERRYRTLVENFPDGAVGLFDENMEYTALGGQLLEEIGLAPEERIGSDVYEIYPEELLAEVGPYFEMALADEASSFEAEFHGRSLIGHTLPLRDDAGEVFAGMVVVQDVTEQREAQRELRESEAKFRMLAENLEEVVWMATGDVEEFVYVNPSFEDVWGISRETLYENPLSFLDMVHPDDRERIRETFAALPDEEFDEEYRITQPDGEVRWVHARGAQVYDEDGELVRVVGTGQDITERKERERELELALDLLDKAERIADVGGWEIDTETMDVFWTDHIFDLLEVPYDEEPSLDAALDMYHEADRPDVEDAIQDALDAGESFDVEARIRTHTGEIRWLRLQGVPTVEDGDVVSLRGTAQDTTERKRREQRLEDLVDELEASNERLEQFAYAASHDLQEPLRMVSSYLQLVERRYKDELDDAGREFIEFAVDGADRMRDMIEGLLEYSRVDSRGNPLEPVSLDSVLTDVLDDLQVRIEESGAEIAYDSLPTVDGDAGQLRQLFQNLLSNAIEYSGDEPPRIDVAAEREGDEWVISVHDEGIGIDPEDADRVFEVFQSLHTQTEHPGTGIGLALCERIVERHDGEIWVESDPRAGTTFSFTLPHEGAHSE